MLLNFPSSLSNRVKGNYLSVTYLQNRCPRKNENFLRSLRVKMRNTHSLCVFSLNILRKIGRVNAPFIDTLKHISLATEKIRLAIMSPNNYRPVSLTSQICKVLEKLILDNIWAHIRSNNIVSCHQHGYI